MDTTLSNFSGAWNEVDELIGILRAWGISFLVGLDYSGSPSKIVRDQESAVALIQHLAQCDEYPRVRDASIALFLLHPELANAVLQAIQESELEIAERIIVLTLATLYLQRLWLLRLTIALGHTPSFPEQRFEFLWESRNLPSPAYHYGKYGLSALQEAEQRRTGFPFTFIGDWQNQVDQLLLQEEAKHHQIQAPLLLPLEETQYEQKLNMSMRPGVDKAAIESFLQQLGRTFHKQARLYLVGGAALVHLGVRPGFTQYIDIQVGGTNEGELIVAIQRLIQQMQVNVEFASPADFMPLPSQWETHARFIGRYGMIDVFYFDFYSIALSKTEQGNQRDIADVKLLVQQGIITLNELDTAYQEVLSQLGKGRYPRITPQRFSERYTAIRKLL
ncbi:MAG TPA: DUF6036 family nucleotidyltransferase [Ktedonobacteraceae bacterium]|nr:DUF6036 family nucleotidyltransferase [Ktedonobacteraceae bacterium]